MDKIEKISTPSLVNVISAAIQIPGVKVTREIFLQEQFKDVKSEVLNTILKEGPIEAGCSQKDLYKRAINLVQKETLMSSGASFVAGLPGGFTMAAAIPADILQFYGFALRLAQEIAYIYGEKNLWNGDVLDNEKITNQLILYCGVMLGSSGAGSTVRVLSSSLAKQALTKIPQQALTKTFYYPIIKSIAKAFGIKMTKSLFAKGVANVVPVIGGVVSGGITFATLRPMGMKLIDTFDQAKFEYNNETFESDWNEIVEINESEVTEDVESLNIESTENAFEKIKEVKQMLDDGIITEEEFSNIKKKLIEKI